MWHIDLTTIPTGAGFWTPYFPFSLPQCWPFCWWIAVVLDQFSRRVIGFEIFRHHPDSSDVCGLLERLVRGGGRAPQVLVSDGEGQFTSDVTVSWCDSFGITPRVGHLGQRGGIAILDRFFRTLKEGCALWTLVPLLHERMRREIAAFTSWYTSHRPHTSLEVCTPDEVYFGLRPACQEPRVEPRSRSPSRAPCAAPQAPVDVRTRSIRLRIDYLHGRRGLPIVTLQRAA